MAGKSAWDRNRIRRHTTELAEPECTLHSPRPKCTCATKPCPVSGRRICNSHNRALDFVECAFVHLATRDSSEEHWEDFGAQTLKAQPHVQPRAWGR